MYKRQTLFDAVIIATPHKTHAKPAVQAFSLGKDVLCDKPAASDIIILGLTCALVIMAQTLLATNNYANRYGSVSYTHLDVYKRQEKLLTQVS